MTSSPLLDIVDIEDGIAEEDALPLRKVNSMESLRGRSNLLRACHFGDGSDKNFRRTSSLGRHRSRSKRNNMNMQKRCSLSNEIQCDFHRYGDRQYTANNNDNRRWSLAGKASALLLLIVSFSDVAFRVVSTQMNQLESVDYYDALSPDVIRPAYAYGTANLNIEKPSSMGLGSAAIASITDALGPILPFTGGIDLRKSEYYTSENPLKNLWAMIQQTYDAFYASEATTTHTGNSESTDEMQKAPFKIETGKYTVTLGASEPFVSIDSIAQLTLGEVGSIFALTTQEGSKTKAQSKASPRVKVVMEAVDDAINKSRGKVTKASRSASGDVPVGASVDAFQFCAAMRIFAEWRLLRQVPEGYKGYAVGMNLGYKDVVQNVAKMERAAQAWMDYQKHVGADARSPTLYDVLQFEEQAGEHPSLPRLKESSGAMGLLWVRRQLHYQTAIFENVVDIPAKYPSSKEAVQAAYEQVYGKYHGWAVQKIFNYSFQASPKIEEIYKLMNPHRLAEVRDAASERVVFDGEAELPSTDKFDGPPPENPFHRIGWEVEKVVHVVGHSISKLGNKEKRVRGRAPVPEGDNEVEEFICAEMSRDAHEHIASYLTVAKPLLQELAGLFAELNMDDPTKV